MNPPDELLAEIADYAAGPDVGSQEAWSTARLCLMDSLGCALLSLNYPACTRLLGPIVPGASLARGARIPGTHYQLEPVQAAFNLGAMIRWLDYNDTWLAAEWGHPSDNLGGILMLADYLNRRDAKQPPGLTIRDVLAAMIKAYEIQGVLALDNSLNRIGLDHVLFVRIASTAVATQMLGGDRDEILAAVSNAWIDGGALRTYRHAPNTGSRKSWASGDATSRAVRLALMATRGEMGYPTALTASNWGFQDVLFQHQQLRLARPLGSYVMEQILFKVSFPAEFHGQTAVEAAIRLHPQVINRLHEIMRIVIETTEPAVRIIDKTGPLHNPADRDHCLQYMVAIGLLHGTLSADHYQDDAAADPRIDALRDAMDVVAETSFTKDYYDPDKRAITNALQIVFRSEEASQRVVIPYPLGHRRRRQEARTELVRKFRDNMRARFSATKSEQIAELFDDASRLDATPVDQFVDLFVPTES